MIEVGNYPFKDKLLDYLNKKEQEQMMMMAQQGQQALGQAPADTAEAQAATDGYMLNPAMVREMMQQMKSPGELPARVQ